MGMCELTTDQGVIARNLPDGTRQAVDFPGDALNNTNGRIIYAYVYDFDTSSSDLLGTGTFPAVTTLMPGQQLMAGPYNVENPTVSCMVPVQFEVAWQF
jgi:hypothetical protein